VSNGLKFFKVGFAFVSVGAILRVLVTVEVFFTVLLLLQVRLNREAFFPQLCIFLFHENRNFFNYKRRDVRE